MSRCSSASSSTSCCGRMSSRVPTGVPRWRLNAIRNPSSRSTTASRSRSRAVDGVLKGEAESLGYGFWLGFQERDCLAGRGPPGSILLVGEWGQSRANVESILELFIREEHLTVPFGRGTRLTHPTPPHPAHDELVVNKG